MASAEGSTKRAVLAARLGAAQATSEANAVIVAASRARLTASREHWAHRREVRIHTHEMAYARLLARFESQPVIEQAKGILMAESRCTPAAAFDLLRRASQRQNLPLRRIASEIVARAVGGESDRVPRLQSHDGRQRQLRSGSSPD